MKKVDIKSFTSLLHELYTDIIDRLYKENYLVNPSAYPFYEIQNCDLTIVYNDTEYFRSFEASFLVSIKNEEFSRVREINIGDYLNKQDMQDFSNEYDLLDQLSIKLNLGINVIQLKLGDSLVSLIVKKDDVIMSILNREILRFREEFNRVNRLRNDELSKREYSERYQFTKYSIEDIIHYFRKGNNDNAEQLEILFEQSMFCYEHNKFLAAAACIGVAIEELCLLILEECGFDDGFRGRNTSIVELAGIMRSKGIITRRLSSVLVAASVIRNSISHASSGYVSAIQTDMLIASFKNLFESYLDYKEKS